MMMHHVSRLPHRTGWSRLAFAAAATAAAVWPPQTGLATAEADCAAIGREALQVDLSTAFSDTRHVVLRPRETLRVTFEAEPGPFGTLTLIEGDGSPRLLLVGPSGTAVSFTPEHPGAFGFQFAKEGDIAARFTVTCGRAKRMPGAAATAKDPALGTGTATLEGEAIEELHDAGPATVSHTDLVALAPQGAAQASTRAAAAAATQGGSGAQVKAQWLDQRYRPASSEGGPKIDPATSGIEVGVNYKVKSAVTVGALAQVNPAAEVLLGAQRSLVIDQGWMAGPFTTIHLAPGLVLDARAAWGEGQGGSDEAATTAAQRRLLSARLANPQTFGAWRFTPSVNFNYLHESLPALGPGSGGVAEMPHVTAAGRIDIGPELAYRTDLTASTFIEPRVVVGGFWDFDALVKESEGAHGHAEMRLKAEAGITIGLRNGPKLQALGALEEGDQQMPDAWSGRLQLNVPLE